MKLDIHSEMILDEYRAQLPVFERLKTLVVELLQRCLNENNILVSGVEARVKTEESLTGKLELKGYKYHSINDITDIVGARIITYYNDDVDLISALMERMFDID